MDKKVVSFEKLNILSQDSGLCGFRKDSLSGALSGQSLLGEESLHVFAIYEGLNLPGFVSKILLRHLLQSAAFKDISW